jgi:hypothetical protein
MLILTPPLMEITATQQYWDTYKVRFVAIGATFVVTLSLALVAQFGLRKKSQALPIVAPARVGDAGLVVQ